MADVLGKTFVEPEIVPPFHGDQISKPVMGQLMDNRICEGEQPFLRHFVLEEIKIVEGDKSSILHGSPLVLMCKNLVIFGEGVLIAKIFLEEIHGLYCCLFYHGGQLLKLRVQGLD